MNDMTSEELKELVFVINYYMHHHISLKSSRYKEYEVILQKLTKSIDNC